MSSNDAEVYNAWMSYVKKKKLLDKGKDPVEEDEDN